jgi:predicted AAA+ superfamily ATPase
MCIFAKNKIMQRQKTAELIKWKNANNRKPLIIKGARQSGKTWLMKDFGKKYYKKTLYVNFEKSLHLKTLFNQGFNIERIILALQAETGISIEAVNTLIIFDEIQAIPEAISSLKYFYEDAPEYHIIAAGSLLGVALHSEVSFPVGKVNFMNLNPMNFTEFIEALGEKSLVEVLNSDDFSLIKVFKSKLIERLKQYYFVGGMPEAVLVFAETGDFSKVRNIHNQILNAYELDFSKHAPSIIVPRIRMVWNTVLAQLSKENKKFIYGLIKKGARAKDYELALAWLIDCGLIHKIHRNSKPNIPLKAYEDNSAFKLYLSDIGLLAAMGKIDSQTILQKNSIFTEFKGSLTEQFVLQEILCMDIENLSTYYWSAQKSTAELDFLIQCNNQVYPIEVKAEENLKAKSLKEFQKKYSPKTSFRFSMSDFRVEDWLTNIPLYMVPVFSKFL